MTTVSTQSIPHSRIAHYPITFFAISMGMLGLTLAVRAAEHAFLPAHAGTPLFADLANVPSTWVLALSVAMLLAVSIGYLAKVVTHPSEVSAEWHHPVRIAFFPAISISLLLLSIVLLDPMPAVAHGVWLAGTVVQGGLALAVIGSWIGHRPFQHTQMTPAWFIPAVGNIIVPIAGAKLGYTEVSWLFFSAGLIFWVILLTLVMNRLMFHDPLPGRMAPTLMILIAPPAVALISWLRLEGTVGPFGHFLLSVAYVFALLVLTQLGKFRNMPFALSWWALSFPLAALSIASFSYAQAAQSDVHRMIGAGLLVLLVAVVAVLIVRTASAIAAGKICVPE
ncbi:MAG: SLAC1 anion channel family protein [Rhodobacteraceae bacterium]|nr:SLAC1 anion channel family protein [Paracoccaceae bacterium]